MPALDQQDGAKIMAGLQGGRVVLRQSPFQSIHCLAKKVLSIIKSPQLIKSFTESNHGPEGFLMFQPQCAPLDIQCGSKELFGTYEILFLPKDFGENGCREESFPIVFPKSPLPSLPTLLKKFLGFVEFPQI